MADFDDIMDTPYYSPRTIEQIKEHMSNKNPWRWRRMKSDYRWLEKQMKNIGLNPHDARYLL